VLDFFLAVGLGIGGSETCLKEPRKSLSNERTFSAISDDHQLFKKLGKHKLSERWGYIVFQWLGSG
jgi:hypothetical protein